MIDLKANMVAHCAGCYAKKHPNADRLSVTKIDDGMQRTFQGDDNGYVRQFFFFFRRAECSC